MDIKFTGKYKSITPFEWFNIPNFVVITGRNGSGKSQLLELLNERISLEPTLQRGHPLFTEMTLENVDIKRHDLSFLRSEWHLHNPGNVNLSNLLANLSSIFGDFRSVGNWHNSLDRDRARIVEIFRQIRTSSGKAVNDISLNEFQNLLPKVIIENETKLGVKIAEVFYDYRLKEIDLLSEGKSIEEIQKEIGAKPWEVMRDILKEAKLDFEFTDPSKLRLKESYQFQLFKLPSNDEVALGDLSSGERVLFSLVFLLYNSSENGIFPKLMLLDEPDAHLHPTMCKQLINVLKNILVEKYGVRVIMTTHSPSTVVMAPIESLFEMSTTSPRIQKVTSKDEVVSLLTEGLIFVGEGTKYFIVEDNDDVDFYTQAYAFLSSENIIDRNIPMVFIPASTNKSSGGKTVVDSWVTKLQSSGLEPLISGLIDEDSGNIPSNGVFKINRYSIENYLVDPIVIYAALMDKDLHNDIIDVGLKIGEEYKLKGLPKETLQSIADAIFGILQPQVKKHFPDYVDAADSSLVGVEFINGISLRYPQWILKRRGKTIMNQSCISAFTNIINHTSLFKAMRKINFYPKEFADLLDLIRR